MADTKQSKFELVIGAVDKFSAVFSGFNSKVDAVSAKVGRMQTSFASLSRATGLNRLSGEVKGIGKSIQGVVGEGKALIGTVSGLVGKLSLVFGAAGGGIFALAKSTANAGDAAAKASARAGVGIKTWQEYAHAASLSDVSNEQLEKSFLKLQDASIKAASGDKTQMSLLKKAGINPKNAKGEIKNADSIFLELADKVQGLEAVGKRAEATNLVKSLLGEEGVKLMPMLLSGADGLKEMRLEAHKLGLVFGDEDAKASEGFNDSITRLQGAFKGIGYTIGRVLLPPLTKIIDKFTAWAAGQREIIGTGFAEWLETLDIDSLWSSIESGFSSLTNLARKIGQIVDFFGGWGNVLAAVAGIIGGKFLLSIGTLIASIGKLGLAIMATPVGWFLAAIAAIGTAVYVIYENWDSFVGYFRGLWQDVKDAFSANWIEGILTFFWNFNPTRLVAKGMNELLAYFTGIDLISVGGDLVGNLWQGVTGQWDKFTDWMKGKVDALLAWIPDWMKEGFGLGLSVTAMSQGMPEGFQQDPSFGQPLGMAPTAKSLTESRSEHVERQESVAKILPPEGWGLQVSGAQSGNYNTTFPLQVGKLSL